MSKVLRSRREYGMQSAGGDSHLFLGHGTGLRRRRKDRRRAERVAEKGTARSIGECFTAFFRSVFLSEGKGRPERKP